VYRKRDQMVGRAVRPGSIGVAHVIGIIQANTYNCNNKGQTPQAAEEASGRANVCEGSWRA